MGEFHPRFLSDKRQREYAAAIADVHEASAEFCDQVLRQAKRMAAQTHAAGDAIAYVDITRVVRDLAKTYRDEAGKKRALLAEYEAKEAAQ